MAIPAAPVVASPAPERLLRIQEAATATGLTPRSIRYYEEMGLLRPAARSRGAYRLYDASDVERLRFIRDLRDEAGFSLAQIGRLLEDEEARIRDRERFRTTGDAAEKQAILRDLIARADRQVATLREKADRLHEMIDAAEARRAHLRAHLAELEGGAPADPPGTAPGERPSGKRPSGAPADPPGTAPCERPSGKRPSGAPADPPGATRGGPPSGSPGGPPPGAGR